MTLAGLVDLSSKKKKSTFARFRARGLSRGHRLFVIVVALVMSFHLSGLANAQVAGTGTIEGTVADTSGAVVPGAMVTATSLATGLKSSQAASSSGSYTLSALPPGDYDVEVQAKGFETSRQHVTLNAFTQLGVNVNLRAGSSQQIEVTAQAPELETENGQVSITIPNSTYEALPIPMNGAAKSATGFLSLVPGVTSNNNFGIPVINGGFIASSLIYVNGMPLASSELQGGGENLNTITTEVIDQFQVISSGVPANYDGQGIVNLSYKSGTNKFHGTLYENFRNTALDAPGFGNTKTPVEHQNEFGVIVGGPIRHDRVFFFGSYDRFKITQGSTPAFVSIPTLAERKGDFSAFPVQIYDPSTTVIGPDGVLTRQPFLNNQVPVTSNVAEVLQSELPQPTNANLQNNYFNTYVNGNQQNVFLAKIDARLWSKDRITGVFQTGRQSQLAAASVLPVPYSSARTGNSTWYLGQVNETHTFTPNLLNLFGANLVRNESNYINPSVSGDWPTKAGLTGFPVGQLAVMFPQIGFGGVDSPSAWDQGNTGFNEIPTSETFQDNVEWVHGKHSFTFGVQVTLEQEALNIPDQYNGGFSFSNSETAALDATGTPEPNTGSGYASYLMGLVDSLSFNDYAVAETGGRWRNYATYVQDDWKVTPKLVVNLGLRYSIPKPFVEVHNRTSWLNPNIANPAADGAPGVLQFAGSGTDSCNCRTNVKTHYLTFGPRIGFAYSAAPKTVIRSAFSIVHYNGGALGGNGEQQGIGNQGYSTAPDFTSLNSGVSPAFNWDNGIPPYQQPPFFSPTLATGFTTTVPQGGGISYDRPATAGRSPYTEEWNFTVEQEFPFSLIMNLTYAGTASHFNGVNGGVGIYSNQIDPKYEALGPLLNQQATPTTIAEAQAQFPEIKLPFGNFSGQIGQMLRPFAQYTSTGGTFQGPDPWADFGTSSYNALQATLARNMKNGLYLLISYTWSKTMDEGGSTVNFASPSTPRTAYNLRQERAVSTIDVPQAISLAEVYSLPFGKGTKFASSSAIVNAIVGNWQISANETYTSGTPMNTLSGNCLVPFTGGCYPDYNPSFQGNPRINGKIGSHLDLSTPYLNVAAFVNAPNYTFGNVPRTLPYASFRNEGYKNENLSLSKTIPITSTVSFQFKADAFNLFNRVQLGGMNTSITSSAFGTVNGQSNAPRQLQLEGYIRF